MKIFLAFSTAIISVVCYAQTPITIADNTFKVSGFGTEEFYYGFAEGDQIIFNFEVIGGKELKEVEIQEYPGISKFMDYKSKKVDGKTLVVSKTGIYVFKFNNNALGGRVCKCKIERIPASKALKEFNTSVYWNTLYDTSYITTNEKYLVKRNYTPTTVINPTEFFINGGRKSLIDGKSRISFPISLPKNTVEWYYQFSASRDKDQIARTREMFNLAGKLSNVIDKTGVLDLAISKLTQPPGDNYCDVYLLDFANSQLFENKDDYKYFPVGTRENLKSGVVCINQTTGGIPYLGLKNPDSGYGVNVLIEVVAIVLEEEWGTREVKHPIVTSRKVPYLK